MTTVFAVLLAIAAVGVIGSVGREVFGVSKATDEPVGAKWDYFADEDKNHAIVRTALKLSVDALRKKLPQKLDAVTTVVDVQAADRTIKYIHELSPTYKLDSVTMRKQLSDFICNDPRKRETVTLGGSFAYYYRYPGRKDFVEVFEIGDCPA